MQVVAVPRRFERFIRAVRVFPEATGCELEQYRRLPDGETELVVRFNASSTVATLAGTRTHALDKPATDRASTLFVRFRVGGAHPFFGRPLSELTDGMIKLAELWPRDLLARLEAADGGEHIIPTAFDALGRMLERKDAYDPAAARGVRRAVERIAQASITPRIPQLAAELGMSERQLRRGFDHVIGLSPKHYLRIVRFQRALRAARRAERPNWAALAEQHGYFDQAHLIADFRALSGQTPTSLVGAMARARAAQSG